MKKIFFYLLCTIVASSSIILSCKKELPCENCGKVIKQPIANAGPDQVITLPVDSVLLDGSRSSADGKIVYWQWEMISAPDSPNVIYATNISNSKSNTTLVKNLRAGSYKFRLTITDENQFTAKDTVLVTVSPRTKFNRPPAARAGTDTTIVLPADSAVLHANESTDPDNDIEKYVWTMISGPLSPELSKIDESTSRITELIQGYYQFELEVIDSQGHFSKDTMQVIVEQPKAACTNCKIVFVSDRDGNEEIYTSAADGSNIVRLTYDAGKDNQPAWSPDGTQIAFVSDRAGLPELYIMNADGSNVVRRSFSAYCSRPTWSPDGTKIAYSGFNQGSSDILVVGALNGSPAVLFGTRGLEDYPAWSPDGSKIVFASDYGAYDTVDDIYSISADGTGFTGLTTTSIFDNTDYVGPSWSPDGSKIAMNVYHRTGLNSYEARVGIMNSDGSGIFVTPSHAVPFTRTCWSPDASKIIYTSVFNQGRAVSWIGIDGDDRGIILGNAWDADLKR